MLYGKINEKLAKNLFAEQIGKTIYDCGLWIHIQHSFLAASPDGITFITSCHFYVRKSVLYLHLLF
jgi:hypothetical protein